MGEAEKKDHHHHQTRIPKGMQAIAQTEYRTKNQKPEKCQRPKNGPILPKKKCVIVFQF